MSYITEVKGWIEVDGYERKHNEEVLSKTKFTGFDGDFPRMFAFPQETGTKNPDYMLFGASINYLAKDEWIRKFERLLKKLKGWVAYVIIAVEQENPIFLRYLLPDSDEGRYRLTKRRCKTLKEFFEDMYESD